MKRWAPLYPSVAGRVLLIDEVTGVISSTLTDDGKRYHTKPSLNNGESYKTDHIEWKERPTSVGQSDTAS